MTGIAALLVNPGTTFASAFSSEHATVFGSPIATSRYDRPYIDEHPRLHPYKDPKFQIIVIDLTEWVGARSGPELLAARLPRWVREAVAAASHYACVMLLCPNAPAEMAIKRLADGIRGPQPFIVAADIGTAKGVSIINALFNLYDTWKTDRDVAKSRSVMETIFRKLD